MSALLRGLIKLDHVLAKAEAGAIITLVVVMTVVVFLQVVYRYALVRPLYWSEELARYLFVWLSLLGAALGLQKQGHFGLDFFYKMLPDRGRGWVSMVIQLLMGVLVAVILVQGIILVQKTHLQESPAMGIPMSWAYACLPVAAGLMMVHLLVLFVRQRRRLPEGGGPDTVGPEH